MAMKPKHEESNPRLKTAFSELVDNQLKSNDPPETRQTLDLLIAQGILREDAKVAIAQAVCLEVLNVMKHNNPFDQGGYLMKFQHRFQKNERRFCYNFIDTYTYRGSISFPR